MKEGDSIILSNETFDYNSDPITYTWNISDIYPDATLSGADYSNETNPLLVAVDDAEGSLSFSAAESSQWSFDTRKSIRVVVENVPPKMGISAKSTSILEGGDAVLDVYFSDRGVRDTHRVSVDWSDGSITESPTIVTSPFNAMHTYRDNGNFNVIGTVRDDDAGMISEGLEVVVLNAPPRVEAGPDQKDYLGATFAFSGTFEDPGVLDTHTVAWDFGDGSSANGLLTPAHKYLASGVFTATFTVTDNDGGVGFDTLSVKVMSAQDGAADVNEYVQGLPSDQFVRTPEAYKIAVGQIVSSVIKLIDKKAYRAAVTLLVKDLRSRFDGSYGGLTKDDWCSDPAVQAEIISRIDRLVAYINTLG